MDYKFEVEEIYLIDWKDTHSKDVNDFGGLSVGVVVHQSEYCVTISSRWLFPGGPKHTQVIYKKDIKEVNLLTYVDKMVTEYDCRPAGR